MDKIKIKSKTFTKSTNIAINSFDLFLNEKYETSLDDVITELHTFDDEKRIDIICDICQSWINSLSASNKSPKTISDYFSFLKLYLHYRKIKITPQDVKDSITFPIRLKEEKYPLSIPKILDLLETASYSKKGLYLALLSSGMRIGEAVQIRRKDITINERITIHIPARVTKTKEGRTTFISKEASKFIISKINKLEDDDLIWGINQDQATASHAEEKTFREYLRKIGFTEKYDSGRLKISLHSFRAFFFTKATRVHDENYAHKMTGHGGYLMVYDRLTDEEKLEMYLQLEPELLVYDQSKNQLKIKKLQEANTRIVNLEIDNKDKDRRLSRLEDMLFAEKFHKV